jgi:hypothetical protein
MTVFTYLSLCTDLLTVKSSGIVRFQACPTIYVYRPFQKHANEAACGSPLVLYKKGLSIIYEIVQEINVLSFVVDGDARTCTVIVSATV